MRRRICAVLFTVTLCVACGAPADCQPIFQYNINTRAPDNTLGVCEVDLGEGYRLARYEFAEPCAIDGAAGKILEDSPLPSGASSIRCFIYIGFDEQAARDLVEFVGSQTIPMKLICGGQIVDAQTFRPITERCAL